MRVFQGVCACSRWLIATFPQERSGHGAAMLRIVFSGTPKRSADRIGSVAVPDRPRDGAARGSSSSVSRTPRKDADASDDGTILCRVWEPGEHKFKAACFHILMAFFTRAQAVIDDIRANLINHVIGRKTRIGIVLVGALFQSFEQKLFGHGVLCLRRWLFTSTRRQTPKVSQGKRSYICVKKPRGSFNATRAIQVSISCRPFARGAMLLCTTAERVFKPLYAETYGTHTFVQHRSINMEACVPSFRVWPILP